MRSMRIVLTCSSLLVPAFAHAQGVPQAGDMSVSSDSAALAGDQTAAPAAKVATTSDTKIKYRLQGGLLFNNGRAGVDFGGGLGARPFHNDALEIAGDLNLVRLGGANNWAGSANFLYNFPGDRGNMRPYAGAGVSIIHSGTTANAAYVFVTNGFPNPNATTAATSGSGATNGSIQLLGGVEVSLKNSRSAFRGEGRLIFTSGALTTMLLVGISF